MGDEKKGRGRPAAGKKDEATPEAVKRKSSGSPAKASPAKASPVPDNDEVPAKKAKGRPAAPGGPKKAPAADKPKRGRGRPPKKSKK